MRRAALALLLPFAAPAFAQETAVAPAPPPPITLTGTAAMSNGEGVSIGTAILKDGNSGVLLRFDLTGLTPGWHGLHLHETGTCADAAAGFKASGAHAGHGNGALHGLLNPSGPETGDLPNLYAAADGSAHAELFIAGLKIIDLIDGDGTAILIHAGEDDHMTQPIGGAGDRVACGVIAKDG
jgi:Cu-Zn family superoxide dismutase